MNIVDQAREFAIAAHGDQKRKFTGEPYWHHMEEVVQILRGYLEFTRIFNRADTDKFYAIAWLHDVLEDTKVTEHALMEELGEFITKGVVALTDCPHELGNRATRKAIDRERLIRAYTGIQIIKCADIQSNTPSIITHDPKFAKLYISECISLLEGLKGAQASCPDIYLDALNPLLKYTGRDSATDTGEKKMTKEEFEVGFRIAIENIEARSALRKELKSEKAFLDKGASDAPVYLEHVLKTIQNPSLLAVPLSITVELRGPVEVVRPTKLLGHTLGSPGNHKQLEAYTKGVKGQLPQCLDLEAAYLLDRTNDEAHAFVSLLKFLPKMSLL